MKQVTEIEQFDQTERTYRATAPSHLAALGLFFVINALDDYGIIAYSLGNLDRILMIKVKNNSMSGAELREWMGTAIEFEEIDL